MRKSGFAVFMASLMAGTALGGVQAKASLGVKAETKYHAVCRRADGSIRWEADADNRVTTVGLNKLLSSLANAPSANWYLGLVSQSVTDASWTNATGNTTSASNPWTAADVGQTIIIRGAGASGNDLVTTIAAFVGAGQVTTTATSGTSVSGARAVWGCRVGDTSSSHSPWSEQVAVSNATRPAFTFGTPAAGSVDNSASPAVFTINADNSYIGGFFMIDQNTVGGTTGTLYGMAVWTTGGFRQAFANDTITVTGTLSLTSSS